jgi:alkaline phosphatase
MKPLRCATTGALHSLLFVASIFFLKSCTRQVANAPIPVWSPTAHPKNIILIIGDGMALSQASASIYWQGGLEKSVFSRFPYVAFHKSHAHDDLVTDSAAGATAFACGAKTDNGTIGEFPGGIACTTLMEEWALAGLGTGIVVSCTATHATPAAFMAHQDMRGFTENIALDYLDIPIDCYIGGGEYFFTSARPDRRNLKDSLRQRGYVLRSGTTFNRLPLDGSAPFMLFTAEREPPTASGGRKYMPRAVEVSTQFLKKRKSEGFFLLVEGSQIDWACHANDDKWLRAEMGDFERIVTEALEFASADGETLVIVTGDHECGGLSLTETKVRKQFEPRFSARIHTAALVPVYSFGPQAHIFQGIFENTELHAKIKAARPVK